MKKSRILIGLLCFILVFALAGCKKDENNKYENPNIELPEVIKEDKSEEKDIERKYLEPIYDEDGNPYVVFSEDYIYRGVKNGSFYTYEDGEEIETFSGQISISKVYLTSDRYESKYKGLGLNIPVEICNNKEEERIVYEDYGIEMWLNEDEETSLRKIKIGDNLFEQHISFAKVEDVEEYYSVSLYDAILECGMYKSNLTDNENIIEIYIPKEPTDYEGMDWEKMYYYYMYSYNLENNDLKLLSENITNPKMCAKNTGSAKNVIIYQDVVGIEEEIVLSYDLFIADKGFVRVNRFANGDMITDKNLKKLENYVVTTNIEGIMYKKDDSYENVGILPKGSKIRIKDAHFIYEDHFMVIDKIEIEKLNLEKIDEDRGGYVSEDMIEPGKEYIYCEMLPGLT